MSNTPSPTLEEKRKEWLEALHGKDRHAIINQLTQMGWDAASFRAVNECRRLAQPAAEGGVQLSGLVHTLIDRGFFTLHMAAVRRLMDVYPLKGERGVYSLAGLLRDMQKHRALLTRQAIFGAERLAYDYEPVRQEFLKYVHERHAEGEVAYGVPSELIWQRHENRHLVIDVLTGTRPHGRRPNDTIGENVLVNLRRKAETASEEIIKHTTKFIAHAATPDSRASVNADSAALTLDHLWTAQEHLCQVASFVSIYIMGDSCPGFLAVPQFNQFEYIDHPLIGLSQVGQLRSLWDSFEKECQNWSQWGLGEYANEFP